MLQYNNQMSNNPYFTYYPPKENEEETGENKALRYAKNTKSVFEDEQDKNVI